MKLKSFHLRLLVTLIAWLALLLPTAQLKADNGPLSFTAKNGSVTVTFDIRNVTHTIQYSTDSTNWNTYASGTGVALNANEKVYFRAETNQAWATPFGDYNTVSSRFSFSSANDGTVEGSGNIMSLYGPDCPNLPLQTYAFCSLFEDCGLLTTAPSLPANTLGYDCYRYMFKGCTSLTAAPALPATVLAPCCYYEMFGGCTSLITAPALPAILLADDCYYRMFADCSNLTSAPVLPATTLAYSCYGMMFENCTSLTTASEMPATTLAEECYFAMFRGCSSLTTASELPAVILEKGCYNNMFYGCTSLIFPPALPATTLAEKCYYNMFYRCSSLTTLPELLATTLANECYRSMFCWCESLVIDTTGTGKQWMISAIDTVTDALTDMLAGTSGTMNGTPSVNTTYYIASNCPKPTDVVISNITTNSFDISFTNNSSATLFVVTTNGTPHIINNNTATIAGLTPSSSYNVRIATICDVSDTSLWTECGTINTDCGTVTEFPYIQDFESGTVPPDCWTQQVVASSSYGTSNAWTISNTKVHDGTYSAFIPDKQSGIKTALITNELNLTSDAGYQVIFWMYRGTGYQTKVDEAIHVYVSPTDTLNVTTATEIGVVNQHYLNEPVEAACGWYQYRFDIPLSLSGPQYVCFVYHNQYGTGAYIDDVIIRETPSCRDIYGRATVYDIQPTSVRVSISDTTATAWDISYGPTGTVAGVGTIMEVAGRLDTIIEGLTINQGYDLYVRRHCNDSDLSMWSYIPVTFTCTCVDITATISNVDFNSAKVTVNANEWELSYGPAGISFDECTIIPVSGTSEYTLTGLAPGTRYDVYVLHNCGSAFSNWSPAVTIQTPTTLDSLPFNTGFEDQADDGGWIIVNGNSQDNLFTIGSDANAVRSGSRALYISNNGSYGYSNNSSTKTYAYRTLYFPSGVTNVSFSWKCTGGESSYDFGRVMLVPVSEIITGGTGTSYSGTAFPNYLYAFDPEGANKMNLTAGDANGWNYFETEIDMTGHEGIYYFVIMWNNDGSAGSNYPIAIDNISISQTPGCRYLNGVNVDNIQPTSAHIYITDETVTAWDISYGLTGFAPDSGTIVTVTSGMDTVINNLTTYESYDIYVRRNCGTEFSEWTYSPVTFIPSCTGISATISDVDSYSARVSVSYSEWELSYGPVGTGADEGTIVTVSGSYEYTLTGLTPATNYEIYVRKNCGSMFSEWSTAIDVHTTAIPDTIPFSTGFENIADNGGWYFVNGNSQDNLFTIGSDANAVCSGSRALYISNNGSYGYSNSSSTKTYAYRTLYFPSGVTNVSFSWKCTGGETNWDFGRVMLVPASEIITGGTGTSYSGTTFPNYFYALDPEGANKMNLTAGDANGWNYLETEIDMTGNEGTYFFVIMWSNDASGGSNYPIAIDNISISQVTCDKPAVVASELTANGGSITASAQTECEVVVSSTPIDIYGTVTGDLYQQVTSAPVTITGLQPNTPFYYTARAICGVGDTSRWVDVQIARTACAPFDVPYTEDFEDVSALSCWAANGNTAPTLDAQYKYSGNTSCKIADGTAVSPEFNESSLASYMLTGMAYSTSDSTTFDFGVMIDPTDVSTYINLGSIIIPTRNTWTEFTSHFTLLNDPDYSDFVNARHFVITVASGDTVYVDDLYLGMPPTCPKPTDISITNIMANSFDISWTDNAPSATQWVVVATPLVDGQQAITQVVTTNPATVSGLNSASPYSVSIASLCSSADTSLWAQAGTITTACDIVNAPYLENFESMTANAVPRCWDNSGSTTSTLSGNLHYVWGVYEYNENKMIRMHNYYVQSGIALINTPMIALPSGASQLKFKYAHNANSGDFLVKISNDQGSTFTDLATYNNTTGNTSYSSPGDFENAVIDLTAYAGDTVIIQFWNLANYGSGAIFVDDICVRQTPTCADLDGTVNDITDATVRISLDDYNTTDWEISYGIVGTAADEGTIVSVNGTTDYTLAGLVPSTDYVLYVRRTCGTEFGGWSFGHSFSTTAIPTQLPFISGFEDATDDGGWTVVNGASSINRFIVGNDSNAVASGSRALYIANDSVYGYNISSLSSTKTYVYRTLRFAPGVYTVSFDWKCTGGETTCDFGRVMLIPGSEKLVGGTGSCYGSQSYNYLFAFDPDGQTKMNLTAGDSSGWNRFSTEIDMRYYTGVYNFVIMWNNDGSGGTQYPIAVDNIFISQASCPRPTGLSAYNITATSADVSWSPGLDESAWNIQYQIAGDSVWSNVNCTTNYCVLNNLLANTTYNVRVQSDCGNMQSDWTSEITFTTPCDVRTIAAFIEDAEGTTGDVLPDCWTCGHIEQHYYNSAPFYTQTARKLGERGFALRDMQSGNIAYLCSQAVNFDQAGKYSFRYKYYRPSGTSSLGEGLRIMVTPSIGDTTNAVEVIPFVNRCADNAPAGNANAWNEYEGVINYQGIGYIMVVGYSKYGLTSYFDDMELFVTPTCFEPTDVIISNVASDQASISWTPGLDETLWNIQYKESTDTAWTTINGVSYPYVLNGLSDNTSYKVRIQSDCSSDVSVWTDEVTFRTLCLPVNPADLDTVSFETHEGFVAGAGNMINCWTVGNIQSTSSSYVPYVYNYYSRTGANSLRMLAFKSSSINADSAYVVMPAMTFAGGISNYEVDFYMRKASSSSYYSYNDTLWVGVVTDPTDIGTMQIVGSAINPTTSYNRYSVRLNGYHSANNGYIVFLAATDQNASHSFKYASFYIDDITVEPSCSGISSQSAIICQGETYTWRGRDLTENGVYYDTLLTSVGCDSVYELNLTVNPTYFMPETQSICQGETYSWRGRDYAASGVYYDSLLTGKGCDSVYQLTLTVNQYVCRAPTNLTATLIANKSFRFDWENPTIGTADVQANNFTYVFSATVVNPDSVKATKTQRTATSASVTGAVYNNEYHFYIKNVCRGVSSAWTEVAISSIAQYPAVDSLHVVSTETKAVTLAWTRHQYGKELKWKVDVTRASDSSFVKTLVATTTSIRVTGLEAETEYTFTVSPRITSLNIGDPMSINATTLDAPAAPVNVRGVITANRELTFTWENGSAVDANNFSYKIASKYIDINNDKYSDNADVTEFTDTTATFTKLSYNTTYYFYVRNVRADGAASEWVVCYAKTNAKNAPVTCEAPTDLDYTNPAYRAYTFTWTNPTIGTTSEQPNNFTYILRPSSEAFNPDDVTPTGTGLTETTLAKTKLSKGATYYFYVRNECQGVASAWVGPIVITVPATAPNTTQDYDGGGDDNDYDNESNESVETITEVNFTPAEAYVNFDRLYVENIVAGSYVTIVDAAGKTICNEKVNDTRFEYVLYVRGIYTVVIRDEKHQQAIKVVY